MSRTKQPAPGRLVAFLCERSALRAARELQEAGRWPDRVDVVPVPCSGRVDLLHLTGALTGGYQGVLLVGCPEEACEFVRGNQVAGRRVRYLRNLLDEAGVPSARVRLEFASPAGAARLAKALAEMQEELALVGPSGRKGEAP